MIDGRLIDVLVVDGVAGPDDERRAELEHALSGHVDLVPAPPGTDGSAVGLRPEHVPRAPAFHAGGPGRDSVVVDEDGERDALLLDEVTRVACVAGPDGDYLSSGGGDPFVSVAQLRGMFPAVQSPEVAEEDEDDRPVGPVVAEAMFRTIGAGKLHVRKSGDIHADEDSGGRCLPRTMGPSKVSVTWCKMVEA